MPDPKLQIVTARIKEILEADDIAGAVILCSPSHLEFLLKLNATWNCIIEQPNGYRIRSRREDFQTEEARRASNQNTSGTILGMRDVLIDQAEKLTELAQALGRHWEIAHRTTSEGRVKTVLESEWESARAAGIARCGIKDRTRQPWRRCHRPAGHGGDHLF